MILSSVIAALTFYLLPAPTILYTSSLTEIVSLPAGYFVMQNDAAAPEGYISVTYDDITGYVRADRVTAVDYTPVTKYETTVTFSCNNDGQPVNLRNAPHKSANVLSTLSPSTSGRSYGTATGDALISGAGDVWYYVSVGDIRGYVYYAHVSVQPTPPNIIEKEEPPAPDQPVSTEPQQTVPQSMSATAAIIFIVALCIPVPFVMFYLFKKPKE